MKAKDAAGNVSVASNSVTRAGSGGGSDLAQGKPIDASSYTFTYVAANANDGQVSTYWESGGGAYPATLTTKLGANADLSQVVVKLNPDAAWSTRTQNIQVLGRDQDATAFTSLAAAKDYTFNPSTGNTVTIPVSGAAADIQLKFASNTGAPGAQVAEFQVIGTPAANPDLKVTGITHTPAAPVESDAISLSATVTNSGSKASKATDLNFTLGGTKAATADVPALAAGASATVTASIGTRDAGSYPLGAEVDPSNKVIEQNEGNNVYAAPDALVVKPVSSSDLVAAPVAWTPSSPSAGDNVTFTVAIKNQGTVASASGAHGVTLTVLDGNGTTVKTLTGSYNGTIAV